MGSRYSIKDQVIRTYEHELEIRDTDTHTITIPGLVLRVSIGVKNSTDQSVTVRFANGYGDAGIPFDTEQALASGDTLSSVSIGPFKDIKLELQAGTAPTQGSVAVVAYVIAPL